MEKNLINNEDLKITIIDTAANLLMNVNKIEKEALANLKCEFGYIYEDHANVIVALFRIFISDAVYYFAVQNGKLQLININEGLFNETIENMKSLHECLRDNTKCESELERKRRIGNNEYIKKCGITVNDKLICKIKDEEVNVKSLDEICKKAISTLITIQIACDINNGDYEESLKYFVPMYTKYGVQDYLNSKEKRIVNGTYNRQDAIDMDWAYETYWALCWCLGLVDNIKDGSQLCDCDMAISFVENSNSLDEFKNHCTLRSKKEILDMLDLYYRYDWCINHKYIDPSTSVGNLNPSNVMERRRGLEWVVSNNNDWYDLNLNA